MKNIQLIKKIYYNCFNRQVSCEGKGEIIPFKGSFYILHKKAKVLLKDKFLTNCNCIKKNGRSTIIRVDKNAKLIINGKFSVFYGGDIICFPGSCLELGSGFFNSNIKIRCTQSIKIGDNVKISHDVTIMDSDAHFIEYEGYEATKPVIIGDNVWIGTRATILKGVKIGDGAIIGAGAVVTNNIPPNCIAVGNPAKVIRENISWRGKK